MPAEAGSRGQPDSLLTETRRLLRIYNLRAKKGLAQHFLVDAGALDKVVAAAELSEADIVLEVGPGLGVLTQRLVAKAGFVISIELDEKLAAILKTNLAVSANIRIINGDILKLDPARLLAAQRDSLPPGIKTPGSYKVVANLPYYITSPVLRHFLEAPVKPGLIVVMVQKEVAREIAAPPGHMSLLAVSIQLYGKPEIIDYVPAASFYPPPEVDSAIVRIRLYPAPAVPVETRSFFRLVRAGFAAARKQLANSLAQGLGIGKERAVRLLAASGIAPQRRAETLTLEEWARLWRELEKEKKDADGDGAGKNQYNARDAR